MSTLVWFACWASLQVTPEGASIHATEARRHHGEGRTPVLLPRPNMPTTKAAADFTRVVFGYYPSWVNDTTSIPWEHLTHLAYFSVELHADGTLGTSNGWEGGGRLLVEAGEPYGVKVVLAATLFNTTDVGTLLASPTRRSALVANLVALVKAENGAGVSIDFESVPSSARADFVSFMALLTSVFHFQIPGSHVSIAMPAVDWRDAYDYGALVNACDGLMIMTYDYYWGGGDPGPCAPLSVGTTWSGKDVTWTVEDYLAKVGDAARRRLVVGVPLYGRDWPTTSDAIPGTKTANGSSVLFKNCETRFAAGHLWDEDSQTPYQVSNASGTWHQLFCEDTASLAAKFDLTQAYDLGGVMFWALGYAPPDHALFAELDARFHETVPVNSPPVVVLATFPEACVGVPVTLDGSDSYDPDGDPLNYVWQVVAGGSLSLVSADTAMVSVTPVATGVFQLRLTVSDGDLAASADAFLTVTSATDGGDSGPSDEPGPSPGELGQGDVDLSPSLNMASDSHCGGCQASRVEVSMLLLVFVVVLMQRARPR